MNTAPFRESLSLYGFKAQKLYAGFATCLVRYVRVRYMFATNMPSSLPLLIHCFKFSCNHKPQAINIFQYNTTDDLFGNKEEISARQITIKSRL